MQTVKDSLSAAQDVNIPSDKMKVSKYQTRIEIFEDPEDILNLAASIKRNGLIQRPVVRRHPANSNLYEVISGHRRIEAIITHLHWKEIPCRLVENLTELDTFKLVLADNIQRRPLTHYEEGKAFLVMKETFIMSSENIASETDYSVSTVTRRIELALWMDKYRDISEAPDFQAFANNVTDLHRELLSRLGSQTNNMQYVKTGLKMVAEGRTPAELSEYVGACLNSIISSKRSSARAIANVEEEEKERKRIDVTTECQRQLDRTMKKAPADLQPQLEKLKTNIEWLISDNYAATKLHEELTRSKPKMFKCVKCNTKYDVSHTRDEQNRLDSFLFKAKGIEKAKPVAVLIPL